jgi:hypothetical protein
MAASEPCSVGWGRIDFTGFSQAWALSALARSQLLHAAAHAHSIYDDPQQAATDRCATAAPDATRSNDPQGTDDGIRVDWADRHETRANSTRARAESKNKRTATSPILVARFLQRYTPCLSNS